MRRVIAWVGRFAAIAAVPPRRGRRAGARPQGPSGGARGNHFNGFIDPVLITSAMGRTPRFVAKATLQKVPLAGWLLRRVGVVFVHRHVDAGGTSGNETAFDACHRALVSGDVVAIFPEGTTHDRPRLDPIKTGAARIALGARAAGADGLRIVPVGLSFPDKVALRSSALVQFGHPIELDEVSPPPADDTDADAVTQLTAVIDQGLREVSPDFPDIETALALEQAALVALSSAADPDPSLEARYDLARRLGRSAPSDQTVVRTAIGRYLTVLLGLRLTDRDVIAPTNPERLIRSAIGIALLVVVLGSVVAATAIINVWPAALVVAHEPPGQDPGLQGHGPRARRVGLVPGRLDHRGRAHHRRRRRGRPRGADGRHRGARRRLADRAGHGPRRHAAAVAGPARADRNPRPAAERPHRRGRRGAGGDPMTIGSDGQARRHLGLRADPPGPDRPARQHAQQPRRSSPRPLPIARAARRRRRPVWLAVAAATAVEGIGSVAYHGPGGRASKRLHDWGLVALTATLGLALASEGRPMPRRPRTAVLATAAVTPAHAQPHGGTVVLVPQSAAGSRGVPRARRRGARHRGRGSLSARAGPSARTRGGPRARRRCRRMRARRWDRRSRSRRRSPSRSRRRRWWIRPAVRRAGW